MYVNRWVDYTAVGKRIPGTRFIAFKVPLKQVTDMLTHTHLTAIISLFLCRPCDFHFSVPGFEEESQGIRSVWTLRSDGCVEEWGWRTWPHYWSHLHHALLPTPGDWHHVHSCMPRSWLLSFLVSRLLNLGIGYDPRLVMCFVRRRFNFKVGGTTVF